jgi:hypothetical protein
MTAKLISDLPVEQMADVVRQAVQKQLDHGRKPGDDGRPVSLTRPATDKPRSAPGPVLPVRPSYTIADFLQFHDEAFIVNAFVGLLQRKPDDASLQKWLKKLRTGTPRMEVLRDLRFSPEGEGRKVRVLGLSFPDSANVLLSRRELLERQIKAQWDKKHRRLKRQLRGLKQRILDLERQTMPIEPPPASAERLENLLRAWETRLHSQGERIARAMDKLQDRLEDHLENPAEVGIRAAPARRTLGP